MLGDGYKEKFSRFLDMVSGTGSSEVGFREVYGRSTADMEMAIRAHFRQMIQGEAVYAAPASEEQKGAARPAGETEVAVTLANLAAHLGRTEEAKKRLQELAAAHPGDADVEGSLGGLEAMSGDRQTALAHYRSAIGHGSTDWGTYWGYARILDEAGGDVPVRIQALTEVLRRNPELAEARLRLARNLSDAARFAEALAELQKTKRVAVAHAFQWFVTMTHAAFALKQLAQAREYLEKARAAARTPEHRAAVDRMAALIEQGTSVQPGSPVGIPDSQSGSERPILRRKSAPAQKKN
jgi:tetratricopeptide (TPR) repeat protein